MWNFPQLSCQRRLCFLSQPAAGHGTGTWHRCTFQANSPGTPGLHQQTCGLSQPGQFSSGGLHAATGHLKCGSSGSRPTAHIKPSGFPRAGKDKGSTRFLISNHRGNYILKRQYLHMWIKSKIQKKNPIPSSLCIFLHVVMKS